MIERLKNATISDIGIYTLKFYNEEKKAELIEFCKINNYSCLPSEDRKSIYHLVGEDFVNQKLTAEMKINPKDKIFDKKTLKKFEQNSLDILFICTDENIEGVVHIVDYNNEYIQVELFRVMFKFESNLRTLLIKLGKENADFIAWVRTVLKNEKDNGSISHWERRINEIDPINEKKNLKIKTKMNEVNQFQTFFLNELLRYSCSELLIDSTFFNIENITEVRNHIAHNKHFTTNSKNEEGTLIYNFSRLKQYIEFIKSFFTSYEYLEKQLAENYTNE